MTKHILVVEDDWDIQEMICAWLLDAGYACDRAMDGLQAIEIFESGRHDLVLLDLMLPKLDGYAVCEWIRIRSDVPIIMLTALDAESDQLKGYAMGADEYVTKPYSMPVLLQRIAAILRRSGDGLLNGGRMLQHLGLALDLDAHQALEDGLDLALTLIEFELLRELIQGKGKVLTYQMLIERVWKYDFSGDERVVYSHIKNLRRKMKGDYIVTVRGVGYKI